MIHENDQNTHIEQKIFLQLRESDQGETLKQMNAKEDESCWSDSQDYTTPACEYTQDENIKSVAAENDNSIDVMKKSRRSVLKSKSTYKQPLSENQSSFISCNKTLKTNMFSQRHSYFVDANNTISQQSKLENTNLSQSHIKSNKLLMLRNHTNKIDSDLSKGQSVNDTSRSGGKDRMNMQDALYKIVKNKLKFFQLKLRLKMNYFFFNHTIAGRTKLLDKKMRRKINDFSDYIPKDQPTSFILKVLATFRFGQVKLNQLPVINPESYIGFSIKILFTLFNYLFLFIFSLIIVFQGFSDYGNHSAFVWAIWVFEIILKLNTAVYEESNVLFGRKQIIIHYFKEQAFFDILPLIIILIPRFDFFTYLMISMLAFLKIKNILLDLNDIHRQLCMMLKRYYLIQLFSLIVKLFLIAHIISSLWYLLGMFEHHFLNLDETWFDDGIGKDGVWWKLYISALYWSLTLMTTGSNIASTVLQTAFTSFIMLFTTIIFGYFVNAIGVILCETDEKDQNKRRDINIINKYMRSKDVSQLLKSQVNLNLEHYYNYNFKKIQEDYSQVLDKISVDLKNELLIEYNKKLLNKIDILRMKFSSETLDELCLVITEEYFFPHQIIFDYNDPQSVSLMYIIQGEVEHMYYEKKSKQQKNVTKIKTGQVFGQLGFFSGMNMEGCVKSTEFTRVLKIERDKFINIIKSKEKDHQIYCQIKDNILLYKMYSSSRTPCLVCNQFNHQESECQLIHVNKKYAASKLSYAATIKQQRQWCNRMMDQKVNSRLIVNTIQRQAHVYQQSNKLINYESYPEFTSSNSMEETNNMNLSDKFTEMQSDIKQSKTNISKHEIERSMSHIEEKQKKHQKSMLNSEEYVSCIENQRNSIKEVNSLINSSSKLNIDSKLNKKENIINNENNKLKKDGVDFDIKSINETLENKRNSATTEILMKQQNEESDDKGGGGYRSSKRESNFKIQQMQFKYPQRSSEKLSLKSKTNLQAMNQTLQEYHDFFMKKYQTAIYNNNIIDDEQQQLNTYLYNPWYFESLKDYEYYFPNGNSTKILKKILKYHYRNTKQFTKKPTRKSFF